MREPRSDVDIHDNYHNSLFAFSILSEKGYYDRYYEDGWHDWLFKKSR